MHQVWQHHVISRFEARALGAPTRPGRGLLSGGSPCYNVYRTADGRHLPEQRHVIMDAKLDQRSFEQFANSLATKLAQLPAVKG